MILRLLFRLLKKKCTYSRIYYIWASYPNKYAYKIIEKE
jgi:hypothetical protein